MYDRERIARGAGAAIAVWALVGLVIMSTGVAYAVPLAGVGGFVITADEIRSDTLVLYPGVGDTSERDVYPQALVELRDTRLRGLRAYKDLDLTRTPVFTGELRFLLTNRGTLRGESILLKSSALEAEDATFDDFAIEDEATGDVRTSFEISSTGGATLEDADIRAHYLTSNTLRSSNLMIYACWDRDNDGSYEYGPCGQTGPGNGNGGGGGGGGGDNGGGSDDDDDDDDCFLGLFC